MVLWCYRGWSRPVVLKVWSLEACAKCNLLGLSQTHPIRNFGAGTQQSGLTIPLGDSEACEHLRIMLLDHVSQKSLCISTTWGSC